MIQHLYIITSNTRWCIFFFFRRGQNDSEPEVLQERDWHQEAWLSTRHELVTLSLRAFSSTAARHLLLIQEILFNQSNHGMISQTSIAVAWRLEKHQSDSFNPRAARKIRQKLGSWEIRGFWSSGTQDFKVDLNNISLLSGSFFSCNCW